MESYIYEPLIHDDHIRILTLKPGSDEDQIEGIIKYVRLSSIAPRSGAVWKWGHKEVSEQRIVHTSGQRHPTVFNMAGYTFNCHRTENVATTYDVLSYVWDDPERVEKMVVNGKWLGIARNLHTGLLRLRHSKEHRRLWIDAICINQNDTNERNHQVRMMPKVYSAASSVIVWLGDPEPDVPESILFYKSAALRGLRKLFQKDWWRRIWIVQEVVAARERVFLLGSTTFPWTDMREICSAICEEESTDQFLVPVLHSCSYQRFRDLDSFRAAGAMPIMYLLPSTQDFKATDPRDKLYVLLGMASDISAEDVDPDYNKPVFKVFQDLANFMVRRGSLDITNSSLRR
ncbi:hypothetical protein LB507_010883 [Fusarium sp. FIESC RH6]|nr:hypothetical protein LB507_010883 [Fusarium sp. FIESC RH6]